MKQILIQYNKYNNCFTVLFYDINGEKEKEEIIQGNYLSIQSAAAINEYLITD